MVSDIFDTQGAVDNGKPAMGMQRNERNEQMGERRHAAGTRHARNVQLNAQLSEMTWSPGPAWQPAAIGASP